MTPAETENALISRAQAIGATGRQNSMFLAIDAMIRDAVNDALEHAAARYVTEADQTEGVQVYRAGILRRIAAELRNMKEPTTEEAAVTDPDKAQAFLDSVPEGVCRSLYCRNVVGVLWERMYVRRRDGFDAKTAAPGCFSDWKFLTPEEALADVRSSLNIIERVAKE
jgi:hypothetical protein